MHHAGLPIDPIWAIAPEQGDLIAATIRNYLAQPEALRAAASTDRMVGRGLMTVTPGGIAVIPIQGTLVKRASWFSQMYASGSMQEMTAAVEAAAGDPKITSIMLDVDSPGGTNDGTQALADAVFAARRVKPVVAQIDGMCCSAAYYVASQASKVYASSASDWAGSIGVRLMLLDISKALETEGVEAVAIDTGPYKSAGVLGTKITPEHRAYFQSLVDHSFSMFIAAVSRGRGLPPDQVRGAADGRVFPASHAKRLGLIDGIQPPATTLQNLPRHAPPAPIRAARAATYFELARALPAADETFLCQQLAADAPLDAARTAWMEEQSRRLNSTEQAIKAERTAAELRERFGDKPQAAVTEP